MTLVPHLGLMQHEDIFDLWEDRRISAGENWYQEIQKAMEAASVAVLLVSADFLNSRFILSEEVPRLLQRRDKEGLRIFPVIIRPCAWDEVKWLARMQVRPKDGKPLSAGNDHQIDTDLTSIAKEIKSIISRSVQVNKDKDYIPPSPEKKSHEMLPSTNLELLHTKKHYLTKFKEVYQFAYGYDGLNKSGREAEEFATMWMKLFADKEINEFKEIYNFAYGYDGLNKSGREAEEFATMWLKLFADKDFNEFKEIYKFAYGYDGLNKSKREAEEFALSQLKN